MGRTDSPAAPRGLSYAILKVAAPLFFSGSMRSTRPSLTRKRRAALIFWALTPNSAASSLLVAGSSFSASLAKTSSRKAATSGLVFGLRGRAAARSSWSIFFSQKATISGSSASRLAIRAKRSFWVVLVSVMVNLLFWDSRPGRHESLLTRSFLRRSSSFVFLYIYYTIFFVILSSTFFYLF